MGFSKIEEIRSLSKDELQTEIISAKKELLQLRIKRAVREPFKSHQFQHIKHRLRQLLMIQKNR